MRAAIYARVSTEEQKTLGNSLESQVEACQGWVKSNGAQVVAIFREDFTGSKLQRPALDEVFELLQGGAADMLVVYAPDRLSRSLAHRIIIRDELNNLGVTLVHVTTGEVKQTPEGELTDNIHGVFAQYESSLIKERLIRGKRQKAKKGKIVGSRTAPYGYRQAGKGPDTRFEIVEEEAEVIILIFQMYLDGTNVHRLVDHLTNIGIPVPGKRRKFKGGKSWKPHMIYKILNREGYTGTYYQFRYNRPPEEWIKTEIDAIIDREIFDQAQEKLKRGKVTSGQSRSYHPRLFSGRGYCQCGHKVIGQLAGRRKDHGKYNYYRCSAWNTYRSTVRCSSPMFPAGYVDQIGWEFIRSQVATPELIELALSAHERPSRARGHLDTLDHRIEEAREKETRLLDLYLDDRIPKDVLARSLDENRAALDNMMKERARIERELRKRSGKQKIRSLKDLIARIGDALDSLDFQGRLRVVNLVDARMEIMHDEDGKWVRFVTLLGESEPYMVPLYFRR
jgi:site-specific DNA recombinase